jgi:hypothetical protein
MAQSQPNRPVRTRMPGGVGGGRREASPYPNPAFKRRGGINEVSTSRSDEWNLREFDRRNATKTGNNLIQALKRRAKLISTLRVEDS